MSNLMETLEEHYRATRNGIPLSRIEAQLQEIIDGGITPGGGEMKKIFVDQLPSENIDDNAIYMVPGENPSGDNNYDEYVHTEHGWEMISSADPGEVSDETIDGLWNDSNVGFDTGADDGESDL